MTEISLLALVRLGELYSLLRFYDCTEDLTVRVKENLNIKYKFEELKEM